ncbi:MAG: ABC transporter substrate-binding protein [Xanthobacteraceae bacterium]
MPHRPRRRSLASRRQFLTGTAAASVAAVTALAAPPMLAQTRKPLRLGILNSFTGPTSVAAESNVTGMEMYLDRISWTTAGRKVELIKEDDQFNPQIGLQKARKFVESDDVDMILGPQASNVAMAIINFVEQTKTYFSASGHDRLRLPVPFVPIASFVDTSRPHNANDHIRLGEMKRFWKVVFGEGRLHSNITGRQSASLRVERSIV